MSKARAIVWSAILLALVAMVWWQNQIITKLRADVAALRSEIKLQHYSDVQNDSGKAGSNGNKELERLRKEHAELLRLRGEVTRLRTQAKGSNEEIFATNPAPVSAALTMKDMLRVATNLTVDLKNEEVMMTGGWDMGNGKKAFVFVTPQFTNAQAITLQSRIVEIDLERATGDLNEYLEAGRLSDQDARRLFKKLEKEEGIDILTPPRVITLSGRQAQVSVMEDVEVNGQKVQLGPVLDFIPVIAADGSSVSLNVQAVIPKQRSVEIP